MKFNYKKVSYLTATAHYVDDNWDLHSVALLTSDFPAAEKKTGKNIDRIAAKNLKDGN